MIEIMLIASLCFVCLSIAWFTVKTGISPMPSSSRACATILKASEQGSEGLIIDLGSGWGTLVFALARKYPASQIIGYELSWLPWLYSQACKVMFGLHNVQLIRQDFLTADLPEAAILTCYLFPQGMNALQIKMAESHYTNCLLISNTFALPDREPEQTIRLHDLYNTPVYIYQL